MTPWHLGTLAPWHLDTLAPRPDFNNPTLPDNVNTDLDDLRNAIKFYKDILDKCDVNKNLCILSYEIFDEVDLDELMKDDELKKYYDIYWFEDVEILTELFSRRMYDAHIHI